MIQGVEGPAKAKSCCLLKNGRHVQFTSLRRPSHCAASRGPALTVRRGIF